LAALFADETAPGEFVSASGKRLVILDNLDEERLTNVASRLGERSVVLNPVSKSGATLETVANFSALLSRLDSAQVVVTTGEPQSPLGQFSSRTGGPVLPVAEDVGGRFSVLSPVGFFPLAFLGIDLEALMSGAQDVRKAFLHPAYHENPALLLALNLYALATGSGVSQWFFMPYCERLRDLGLWWQLLVAESLGKRHTLSGEVSPKGLTPVVALGPRDQHSLLQLLLEGPADKVGALIRVAEPPGPECALAEPPAGLEGFSFLNGRRVGEIASAELTATQDGLTKNARPNYTVTLPRISPQAAGEFLLFHEVVVSILGVMLQVNPFDQPAVDEGKKIAREILQKKRS
jgi:glucose-6-phosphate isomerase